MNLNKFLIVLIYFERSPFIKVLLLILKANSQAFSYEELNTTCKRVRRFTSQTLSATFITNADSDGTDTVSIISVIQLLSNILVLLICASTLFNMSEQLSTNSKTPMFQFKALTLFKQCTQLLNRLKQMGYSQMHQFSEGSQSPTISGTFAAWKSDCQSCY